MSSHKNKEHLNTIKEHVHATNTLDTEQKSSSLKIIEEWYVEDKAAGTLKSELLKISLAFEEVFSELGLK